MLKKCINKSYVTFNVRPKDDRLQSQSTVMKATAIPTCHPVVQTAYKCKEMTGLNLKQC